VAVIDDRLKNPFFVGETAIAYPLVGEKGCAKHA
jgi:hypothetical protein